LSNVSHRGTPFSITNPSRTDVETWRKGAYFRIRKSVMADH
jgi:hypothetical protein